MSMSSFKDSVIKNTKSSRVAPRGHVARKIFTVRASEMAQICLVFIAVFAYKDTKKYPF